MREDPTTPDEAVVPGRPGLPLAHASDPCAFESDRDHPRHTGECCDPVCPEPRYFGREFKVDGIHVTPYFFPTSIHANDQIPERYKLIPYLIDQWMGRKDELAELMEEGVMKMVRECKRQKGVAITSLEVTINLGHPLFQIRGLFVIPTERPKQWPYRKLR